MKSNIIKNNYVIHNEKEFEFENYWRSKFDGEFTFSEFIKDYANTCNIEYLRDTKTIKITDDIVQKLKHICKNSEQAMFIFLLSGIEYIIHRFINSDNLLIGMPFLLKNEIFKNKQSNLLPISYKINNSLAFKEFLLQVKDNINEAYKYRIESHEEIFNTSNCNEDKLDKQFKIVVLTNHLHHVEQLSYLSNEIIFYIDFSDDDVKINLVYNKILFNESTIIDIIEHLMSFFIIVLDNLSIKMSDINLLTNQEEKTIIYDFNNTTTNFPFNLTIKSLFEEQVELNPDNIALCFNETKLTYKELNKLSNKVANFLVKRGIEQNSIVGILLEKSIEMIIVILGILKAGGTYLPIDPEYPEERIARIIYDSNTKYLVTNSSIVNKFSYTKLSNTSIINDIVLTEPREQITDLNSLPYPNRSLIDYDKYKRYIGMSNVKDTVAIQATRGCPYNCAYCHKIWPKSHKIRSAENIYEEVLHLYKQGKRNFVFIDDIFNLDRENSKKFFEFLIKNNINIRMFFPNGIRGDLLDKEYIDLMIAAGTIQLALALETASPRLQKMIGKNINLDKLRDNIEYITTKHHKVILDLFIMVGFPSETEEEAKMTLEYVKSIKWLDFPVYSVLKIYPNTDMEKLALKSGITKEAIDNSAKLAYHELPDTLPFSKEFVKGLQASFLNDYFLSKERLTILFKKHQQIMTEDELVQKYNSYLPTQIKTLSDILNIADIDTSVSNEILSYKERLSSDGIYQDDNTNRSYIYNANDPTKLNILLIDLSQYFSSHEKVLYDVAEPPLGLIYLLTYLNNKIPGKVNGRILKSRFDFDDYKALYNHIMEFKPDIIGIRSLSYYKDFMHKTVSLIRQWGVEIPIIVGGPYATSEYNLILSDPNIDLAVLGEGEATFYELVELIISNNKIMPSFEALVKVKGLAIRNTKELRSITTCDILMIDELSKVINRENDDNLESRSTADDLAYVIYTSGSTGIPKGNLISNKNVIRIARNTNYISISSNDNILQLSNYSFDGSVFDIFSALLNGAKLTLVDKNTILDIKKLVNYIKTEDITVFFLTTALFNFLVDSDISSLKNIRKILFGGERVSVSHTNKAFRILGPGKIIHMYGPTESTVFATYFNVDMLHENALTIPIGKPVSNTKIIITDELGKLQPIGAVGEICIAGDGIGKGYLNRPELNKTCYTMHPIIGKIYKTGDLGRWLKSGDIEYLNRHDTQVKLRGFRIELGEIENQLLKYGSIKQAFALIIEHEENKHLCVYYVSNNYISPLELKVYLSKNLPSYMVPSFFMQVDQIPLSNNGKVNIKKLPHPVTNIEHEIEEANEISPTEDRVIKMWKVLLGLNKVNTNSNFFELGGHSLIAAKLITMIQKEFNVNILISQIIKNPTIKELSRLLDDSSKSIMSHIRPTQKNEYYPISPAQKRMYILDKVLVDKKSYNVPRAELIYGEIDIKYLEKVFGYLIDRHESLRTSFVEVNDEIVQVIHKNINFRIEFSETQEKNIYKIIERLSKPFDLCKDPLLRVHVVRLGEQVHLLIIDLHHIVMDIVSMGILLDDFAKLYNGEELQKSTIHYKDYTVWYKEFLEKKYIAIQEKYWLNEFKNGVPTLKMPLDYPREQTYGYHPGYIYFRIDQQTVYNLNTLNKTLGLTQYTTLLGVLFILLSKYTEQEDIVVGSPVAGRGHVDLDRVIGVFINTIAIRNCPKGTMYIKDFLVEVQNKVLLAQENQHFQFDMLVEKLNIIREVNRNPIFDVMFDFLDVPKINISSPRFRNIKLKHNTSQFDIVLEAERCDKELLFTLQYNKSLFRDITMKQFSRNYIKILNILLNDIDLRIEDIEIT